MRTSSARALVARLLLGVMLFTQAALAGAACSMPGRSPAQAIATAQAMPCHHAGQEPRNANLCLADCLSFDQSSDTPQLPAMAPNPAPVLSVALAESVRPRIVPQSARLASAADPPLRILFQSFLI